VGIVFAARSVTLGWGTILTAACSSPSGTASSVASGGAGSGGAASPAGAAGSFALVGSGGSPNLVGGGSGGASGAAGSPLAVCPDLQTPPANCPAKVYQGSVVLYTQAEVDALEGYTDIEGSVNIAADNVGGEDIVNLDALHCLQTTHFELVVSALNLASLDGLRELTNVGGWVDIHNNPLAKIGCGLRKLSKVGRYGSAAVNFERNGALDRISLPLLDSSAGNVMIDSDSMLTEVVGGPAMTTINQFFIYENPVLSNVSGFAGLSAVSKLWLSDNPMLPICQAQAIANGLSAPPTQVLTSGDLGASCP